MEERPKHNPDFVARKIAEDTILLPVIHTSDDINAIYTLNPDAARVWELIDGRRTVQDIKQQLVAEFNDDSSAMDAKLSELLDDLRTIQAIV